MSESQTVDYLRKKLKTYRKGVVYDASKLKRDEPGYVNRKTIIFLCGLVGSGKTTYALSHFRNFTDLDYMHEYARKIDQINWTKGLLKINDVVCHITSYPTHEELSSFEGTNKRFLLMNTSENQCKTNILIRGRERDIKNLVNVFKANEEYSERFKKSPIKWEDVNIF